MSNDEYNPFEGLTRLYSEDNIQELADSLRRKYDIDEENLQRYVKQFTKIYVDDITDDVVWIDSEKNLNFN